MNKKNSENTELEQKLFDTIVKEMNLSDIIAELPPEKLTFDTPLFEALDPDGIALDSIAAFELVVLLESNFHITVADEDMKKLTSIKNIAAYLEAGRNA